MFLLLFFIFILHFPHFFYRKSAMSSSFAKIRRRNGSFYASDIHLDPFETIRVVGEAEGVRDGLRFTVPGREARITDFWRGRDAGEAQTGHFHVISLQSGLRFPLPGFVLELLHDYGVAPSQLAPNAWRIIAAFYLGCHIIGVPPTSRLFRTFYFLKTREEFYFLQARGKPIVTGLPDTNKGWKPLFLRIVSPIGFGVDLQWRVAKAGGNKMPALTLLESKHYSQIFDSENGFPWTLVQDRDEVERYWPRAVLPNAEPQAAVPIGPELQIGEPSWAGFTLAGTF